MNNRFCVVLLSILMVAASCKKAEKPQLSVLPLVEGAELNFRGFVTDDAQELKSQLHFFSRKFAGRDTVGQRAVYVYETNNTPVFFYTDEKGTVWQFNTEDVARRIVAYGFSYQQPVIVSYWQILLKVDQGVGSEWSFSVDTTFSAIDSAGKENTIRYIHNGKARYEGLKQAFLPQDQKYVPAHDAYWHTLNTFIINETTGDTLFASEGTAHQYFHERWGAVKYITDFIKSEIGQNPVSLHGTWELVDRKIPE